MKPLALEPESGILKILMIVKEIPGNTRSCLLCMLNVLVLIEVEFVSIATSMTTKRLSRAQRATSSAAEIKCP